MTEEEGEIPQSTALAEPSIDSISELFSRNPEELSDEDLARMLRGIRLQRERWKATEDSRPARQAKTSSVGPKSLVASTKAEELDL